MKINNWRVIGVSLFCLTASLSLVGCSGKNDGSPSASPLPANNSPAAETKVYAENGLPQDEKVTLKVGFFEGGMGREYFDYAMDTFKKKFPNVNFAVTYSPEMTKIITTKVSANNDNDMFDMFSTATDALSLVKAGKLEPQDDVWDRKAYDGNGKTLKELSLDGQFASAPRFLGKTYAVPIVSSGGGLFFDKALFEEHGWNQNPKTWKEFVALCESIKAKGIIPITYPGKFPGYVTNGFGDYKLFELANLKGNLKTVEDSFRNYTQSLYMSPESVELWNRIYELGKKGFFPEGVAALNHTQSQMQVLQRKAALVSTGVWVQNEMKESTPQNFKWGFMSVPMGDSPDDTIWVRNTTSEGFFIWAAKPELTKKWAKEFSAWLWNLDIQGAIAETGGQLPIRKDFTDDQTRAGKLQDAPRALLEYMKRNKVHIESEFRATNLTDPAAAQAKKVMQDATSEIAAGKQDPLPKLQEADQLLKKAIEAQTK
ncbi:extracellular solute-binding protein [Paenibacillus hodogayensis]|uniref:Extracellular solute-binding protein n=1 Tax=Paenibacillus hodogayensis TaxID=279208 RepID=A0ABV5VX32_9BACL